MREVILKFPLELFPPSNQQPGLILDLVFSENLFAAVVGKEEVSIFEIDFSSKLLLT